MEYGNDFKPKPIRLSQVDLEVRDLGKLKDYLLKNQIAHERIGKQNISGPIHGGHMYNFRAPNKTLRELIKMMQNSPENSVNQEDEFLYWGINPYKGK